MANEGRLHRPAKQRRAAAGAFREAFAIFQRLGAVVWEEQARSALDVVGPRRRAPDELTTTELRVAELAAARITNREIARAMFMSGKTVEAHVARIYRKLGIHSRAELGAWMAATLKLEAKNIGKHPIRVCARGRSVVSCISAASHETADLLG